ncbi:hypothetical protein AK812_SmicGene33385 [Symbiodinium microadriaticum]|uniref:PLA2c domain-containing protein n=1 Tax=Symbiodinium microadriaticum TaxID=2951 RepID=A0A1Q9CRT8_SYMMI|nr:hypothetical protein AK812_SmicGene33385 [Symbiodinium microadriaticum]
MMLTLVFFASAWLAVSVDNTACAADDCSARDDSALLQHRGRVADRMSGKGLALEGGGFMAHAAHTGVLTALLNVTKATSKGAGPDLRELMRNVKVISSISGGSWWLSQLAYSQAFLTLIETMAVDPKAAGLLYQEQWISPFLLAILESDLMPVPVPTQDLGGASSDNFNLRAVLESQTPMLEKRKRKRKMKEAKYVNNDRGVADSFGMNFIELLIEVFFLGRAGSSWQRVVAELLHSTSLGDMTGSETLGSPVNEWATGKWWLAGTSISTPGGKGPGTCQWFKFQGACALQLIGSPGQTLIYENGTDVGSAWMYSAPPWWQSTAAWTPARFSTVLGAGAGQPAPMKFCENECENLQLHYQAIGETAVAEKEGSYDFFATSNTSLFSAVSGSSAFAGFTVILDRILPSIITAIMAAVKKLKVVLPSGLAEKIQQGVSNILHAKLAVWSESAKNGVLAFQEASATLKEITKSQGHPPDLSLDSVAEQGLMALVDGGMTDNTGIGHALASGQNEIICFEPDLGSVWQLMGGMKDYVDLFTLPDVINPCPMCFAAFQLFKENYKEVQSRWQSVSTQLWIDPALVHNLNSISVGTLTLTTQKNDYFGVPDGRSVVLHIVSVNTSIGIGGYNYYDYPKLVQDIVTVLVSPSNKKATGTMLEGPFNAALVQSACGAASWQKASMEPAESGATSAVMVVDEDVSPFSRIWCLFEVKRLTDLKKVLDAALRMSRDFHLISSCGAMGSNLQMVAEDEKRQALLDFTRRVADALSQVSAFKAVSDLTFHGTKQPQEAPRNRHAFASPYLGLAATKDLDKHAAFPVLAFRARSSSEEDKLLGMERKLFNPNTFKRFAPQFETDDHLFNCVLVDWMKQGEGVMFGQEDAASALRYIGLGAPFGEAELQRLSEEWKVDVCQEQACWLGELQQLQLTGSSHANLVL